jgi:dipeptidyl aminopeptidase/acylaminoacyl peptidase
MRMQIGYANDLLIAPLDNGANQQMIATQATQVFGDLFNWSPDSRYIAYTCDTAEMPDGHIRLFVVPTDGSAPPVDITGDQISTLLHGNRAAPRWSTSGHELYILGWGRLWVLTADGSYQREIRIELPDKETKDWIQPATSPVLWTTEAGLLSIVIGDYQTLNDGFACVDLEQGEVRILNEFPAYFLPSMEIAPDGSAFYVVTEKTDQPPAVWKPDPAGKATLLFSQIRL